MDCRGGEATCPTVAAATGRRRTSQSFRKKYGTKARAGPPLHTGSTTE